MRIGNLRIEIGLHAFPPGFEVDLRKLISRTKYKAHKANAN
jgi:hypothetical protein